MFEIQKAFAQTGYVPIDDLGGRLQPNIGTLDGFNFYLNDMKFKIKICIFTIFIIKYNLTFIIYLF
jgi:hypothetical protein